MSEIKLRAKRKNTEDWLMFNLSDLFHSVETGLYQVCIEDVGLFAIDPATIQLAADPRKAMLEDIRTRIYQEFDSCEHHFVHEAMEFILDEMEAKL